MGRIRLTPRARRGLLHVLEYVADVFGAGIAGAVLDRLEAALARIADFPGIGRIREDITDDDSIRFLTVGPTVIAYRPSEGDVEGLFIERGERDWERLLRDED